MSNLATPADFGVFFYSGSDMLTLLGEPSVTSTGPGVQFVVNSDAAVEDLEISSGRLPGGGLSSGDARISVSEPVSQTFTAEWVVKLASLPTDFTDLTRRHVYLGVHSAQGAVAGLFVAKVGWAYTGSVSFPVLDPVGDPDGELQLDTSFQPIPGSSAYAYEDEYVVVRIAANFQLDVVYVYVTRLSEVASSGQKLRAILPVIPAYSSAGPVLDQSLLSVRGDEAQGVSVGLDTWALSSELVIPNVPPVADAGIDQAIRLCSIVKLSGENSFDPEGSPLAYQWLLTEAPNTSQFCVEKSDGYTQPELVPTGFTDRLFSTELGVEDSVDPIEVGDVLLFLNNTYTITETGVDGNFYVRVGSQVLPDNASVETFKVLRQRGVSNPNTVEPTFLPDVPGFYSFELTVNDGDLDSEPSAVVVNAVESPLPRGCVPDLTFIFEYLSDFWNLVDDREKLSVFWSAMAQVCATELYTLWQYEYNASLRDIQRTFVRRLLHYDLLLGEPVPELTRTRLVLGGIVSTTIPSGGLAGFRNSTLALTSPIFTGTLSVTFKALEPAAPDSVRRELETRLQNTVDDRIEVVLYEEQQTGDYRAVITAPFPMTVESCSIPLFSAGQDNRPLSGSSGSAVAESTYKVDVSLEGISIQEDDFLVVGGVAYRIVRVLTSPADDFPKQRIVVKEKLPTAPSVEWRVCGWASSEFLDFYSGLVGEGDYVDLEVTEASGTTSPLDAVQEIVEQRVRGVGASLPDRVALDLWEAAQYLQDDSLRVLLVRVVRRSHVPVASEVADVPTLQDKPVVEDDRDTLRRNVDFFLESFRGRRSIRFVSGRAGDAGDVWEGLRPPDRLWAEYTFLDNAQTIEDNFGAAAGLTLEQLSAIPGNIDYLSAVRGLWYAYVTGPTVYSLRVGVQILLGLPFAEEEGVIEEIRSDFSPSEGRILVRDTANVEIVRSYRFPRTLDLEVNPETGAAYVVGDVVGQFAPLVSGAEVTDYITDPTWFEGLIGQGSFYEVEKFNRFLVRARRVAFNIESLLLVRDFILSIKPTYTYPLFLITQKVEDTTVDVTDEVEFGGVLSLYDSPCALQGVSWMYDEPRAAGGGWRNQFDADQDPDNADPVFPAPDADVSWAYDKTYLCPEDRPVALLEGALPPGAVTFDGTGEAIVLQPAGAVGDIDDVAPREFSISAWYKVEPSADTTYFMGVVGCTGPNDSNFSGWNGWFLHLFSGTGAPTLTLSGGLFTGFTSRWRCDQGYNDGQEHHLVVTAQEISTNNWSVVFYIDGSPVSSSTIFNSLGGNSIILSADCLTIGGRGTTPDTGAATGGYPFEGTLRQIATYRAALTAGEVTTIYNAGSPPDLMGAGMPSDLYTYWPMNDIVYPNVTEALSGAVATMYQMEPEDVGAGLAVTPLLGVGKPPAYLEKAVVVGGLSPIPASPGLVLASFSAPITGNVTQVRVILFGDPGVGTDYEVVVDTNSGAFESVFALEAGTNTERVLTLTHPVSSGQAVVIRIRPATGGERTTSWSGARVYLTCEEPSAWTLGGAAPAGEIANEFEV